MISTLDKAGQLSLEQSGIEEILMNSATLKGKISVIYSVLKDRHDSPVASLKNVWQKDLGCDLDEDQWGCVCTNVFTP